MVLSIGAIKGSFTDSAIGEASGEARGTSAGASEGEATSAVGSSKRLSCINAFPSTKINGMQRFDAVESKTSRFLG